MYMTITTYTVYLRVTLAPLLRIPTEDAYSYGHLVLSYLWTCMCSNVETNLGLSCLRTFEFLTSLGTSLLLFQRFGSPSLPSFIS